MIPDPTSIRRYPCPRQKWYAMRGPCTAVSGSTIRSYQMQTV
ncbi:hypothetical protein EVA_20649 [gut metagenome]|uniref:Uncharacterized protein n=1 Tax=gut metagenome TaxID=749906 RepID=J9FV58_9ZZZZ